MPGIRAVARSLHSRAQAAKQTSDEGPYAQGNLCHRFSYDTRSCNYQFYEGANIAFRSATCYVGDDCTNINNYNFTSDWMTRRNDN